MNFYHNQNFPRFPEFLLGVNIVLFGIEDWKVINSIMDVVEEFQYELPIGSNKSKKQKSSN